MSHRFPLVAFGISAALVLVSCSPERHLSRAQLPPTPAISTEGRFALVADPYVALRDRPGTVGVTLMHARRGEVHEVTGNEIVDGEDGLVLWVRLEKGWAPARSVQLFSSRPRAENAASVLK